MARFIIRSTPQHNFSGQIKTVCKSFLASECILAPSIQKGRMRETLYYPIEIIKRLLKVLEDNYEYCNSVTRAVIDEIILRDCVWKDPACRRELVKLKTLVEKLYAIPDYWIEDLSA